MKWSVSWLVFLILVLSLSCSRQPEEGVLPQVRPAVADGSSVMALLKEIEGQLDRVETLTARGPELDKQSFEFDLSRAVMIGPESARLTVAVFTDFQCSPHCRACAEVLRELISRHPAEVRLAFFNYPLNSDCNPEVARSRSAKSCLFAEASLAAHEQGKFLEMHDWLFEHQGRADLDSILEFARTLGMDETALRESLASHQHRARVIEQAKQLVPAGVQGVPAVFINGRMVHKAGWSRPRDFFNLVASLLGKDEMAAARVVDDPRSLPEARVILGDGTRLEDRLQGIEARLKDLEAPGGRPAREMLRAPGPDHEFKFRTQDRPAWGPEDAPVQAVLFYDLLDPDTEAALELAFELHQRFPRQLRIVFKVLPARRDPLSAEAHQAALAADEQGRFREAALRLAQVHDNLTPELIREIMVQVGVSLEAYDRPETQRKLRRRLTEDHADARRTRLSRTPALFLDGKHQPRLEHEFLAREIAKIAEERE